MRKYRNYTDDDVILATSQVKSMGQLLKTLNLKVSGGNYINIRRLLQKLELDCSHWTGQGWNKDKQLKDWSEYTRIRSLKKHLIKLKGNICEICHNKSWLDNPIKLEIHHKDNNRTNNQLNNLQLLCPNCHSFTAGFRNPNFN
jgi:hypothetical protein